MGTNSSKAFVTQKSVHEFTVKDASGKEINLSTFKGKVLLIVNVASHCGLGPSNYAGLSKLYTEYKDKGFEILAFPCDQFASKEPGSSEEIKEYVCTRFKAEFPIFEKINVNGADSHQLYKFLKANKGGSCCGDRIKWNFTKFLVDQDGKVVNRYAPTTSPTKIAKHIEKLL